MENHGIIDRLARIEEKLDAYLFRTSAIETKQESHDGRIRTLELGYGKILAGLGLCGFIFTIVSGFFH